MNIRNIAIIAHVETKKEVIDKADTIYEIVRYGVTYVKV